MIKNTDIKTTFTPKGLKIEFSKRIVKKHKLSVKKDKIELFLEMNKVDELESKDITITFHKEEQEKINMYFDLMAGKYTMTGQLE